MRTIVVIDFETTGISPGQGARAIEVGAVMIQDGRVCDRYQDLMNPGVFVPPFISKLTGISNSMVSTAPPVPTVIRKLHAFIKDAILVAHNAPFDRKFLMHEGQNAGVGFSNPFLCTMLLSRRVFPSAPNYKLGTLASHAGIKVNGSFHRALADAEVTAQLFLNIIEKVREKGRVERVSFDLMDKLQKLPISEATRIYR